MRCHSTVNVGRSAEANGVLPTEVRIFLEVGSVLSQVRLRVGVFHHVNMCQFRASVLFGMFTFVACLLGNHF